MEKRIKLTQWMCPKCHLYDVTPEWVKTTPHNNMRCKHCGWQGHPPDVKFVDMPEGREYASE